MNGLEHVRSKYYTAQLFHTHIYIHGTIVTKKSSMTCKNSGVLQKVFKELHTKCFPAWRGAFSQSKEPFKHAYVPNKLVE